MSRKIFVLIGTLSRLGPLALLRVAMYRVRRKLGLYRQVDDPHPRDGGVFFLEKTGGNGGTRDTASDQWNAEAKYFGHRRVALSQDPPDWHRDPIAGVDAPGPSSPWWKMEEFAREGADIKSVWEASRFPWAIPFAERGATGDSSSIDRLNAWIGDWWNNNPCCKGVNWGCGQEASIRVLHLAMSAIILRQSNATQPRMLDFVEVHCRRIRQTVSYALGQDNNHGVSEAAALYVGGSWLALNRRNEGDAIADFGKKMLMGRVARLVAPDGSFSMYSVAYHREVLDVFSMVEIWRRFHGLEEFHGNWRERMAALTLWLWNMMPEDAQELPVIGAADGSSLLPVKALGHQDGSGSLSIAAGLFLPKRSDGDDVPHPEILDWFGMRVPDKVLPRRRAGQTFGHGGFAVLRSGSTSCFLRFPRFRFRPNQADLLHVDLWVEGSNVLRDAGSYSYNAEPRWQAYFPGTEAHNTIQFDGRDQMPRLGRFLFGGWLKTDLLEPLAEDAGGVSFGAGYRDREGASHLRRIRLTDSALRIEDHISGFRERAVLRWRLQPGNWKVEGRRVCNGRHAIEIGADIPVTRFELVEGWESRHYLEKTKVPVLEVEVDRPGMLVTDYRWNP